MAACVFPREAMQGSKSNGSTPQDDSRDNKLNTLVQQNQMNQKSETSMKLKRLVEQAGLFSACWFVDSSLGHGLLCVCKPGHVCLESRCMPLTRACKTTSQLMQQEA